MRILLDECLPKRLKRDLVDHDARTVPEMGWASKENGDLLALAETEFHVFSQSIATCRFNRTSAGSSAPQSRLSLRLSAPSSKPQSAKRRHGGERPRRRHPYALPSLRAALASRRNHGPSETLEHVALALE